MPPIQCPHCAFEIALKGARPGRYAPSCPSCKSKFVLIIPNQADGVPTVKAAVETENQRTARQPVAHQTMATQVSAAATRPSMGTGGSSASAALAEPPAPSRPHAAIPSPAASPTITQVHGRLGGYELLQKLGQGGMGAVYLARQISLDRNVAIKVLTPRLAADPAFVARFTREAYAVAQLTHHNVVQIHDIGVEPLHGIETNFFSMEFVPGKTLGRLVNESGKLDAEAAAGYILQAARGLDYAHQHGLIHRDVKPDNLLLNEQGVLKVADLGLVKRIGSEEKLTAPSNKTPAAPVAPAAPTQVNIAMGTPAYMPPEQFRDASSADARADIYALGCTFYDLLTGHPPFVGNSADEVMTKHATESPVPPDRAAKHVPAELSSIVMRMIAKRPQARYQTMADVISALEAWFGVESGKPFSPSEEHVNRLENSVRSFNQSGWAPRRKMLIAAFAVISLLMIALPVLPAVGHPVIAVGAIAFLAATTLFYQAIYNISRRTFLTTKVREFVFDCRVTDWLKLAAGVIGGVLLAFAFGVQWVLLAFIAAALVTAAAFYFVVDELLRREREVPLLETEKLLKEMRLRGLDENAIRHFVAKYAGARWEEFYEALFGYEAKRTARDLWGRGERARNRPKYAAWRDPIIAAIERRSKIRREMRELRLLARVEAKALAATGLDQGAAARKGRKAAERMMDDAASLRESAIARSAFALALNMDQSRGATTVASDALLFKSIVTPEAADAQPSRGRSDISRRHESYLSRRYGSPIDLLLGRSVRLILGILILLGFARWWNQNSGVAALTRASQMMASREDSTVTASKSISHGIEVIRALDVKTAGREPLEVRHLPPWLCNALGSWQGGLAGLCLVLSALCYGRLLALGVLLGAATILFGNQAHVLFLQDNPALAMGLGTGIIAAAMVFLRQ